MKRLTSFLIIFLITFAILGILGVVFAGFLMIGLPNLAADKFGSSADHIDPVDRAYLSAVLLAQENDLLISRDPLGTARTFEISMGETTYELTRRLETEGIIKSAAAMRNFLVYSGLDTSIQAGRYSLSSSMTALQIAAELQDSTPDEVVFRVLPGWRMEEIAAALPTSGLNIAPEAFIAMASMPPSGYGFNLELPPGTTSEGFLYPDSYRFDRDTNVEAFITKTLENFQIKVNDQLLAGFKQQELSLYQGVIIASIVQKEAVIEDEAPAIASVFLNRITQGMPLESDPTVQYTIGYHPRQKTWWTNPLSSEDLLIDSPYNTYIYPGLPPGPISNPGLNALQAVANPDQTPYFYFRAACDGSGRHSFAETYQGHLDNACP
jgi:UPF0755 protein